MALKVHHLNCATMCPVAGRVLGFPEMVCHCLAVETPSSGLVLIDTGFGLADIADPSRLGPVIPRTGGPRLDADECAVNQVAKLGFSPKDVRHILITHLDLDHAGGIPDFPHATVHVLEAEHRAAFQPGWRDRLRYRNVQFRDHGNWARHAPPPAEGERWYGFEAVRDLAGLPPEILMIPLVGHSHGHSGVAVQAESGWLLHCGDAYYFHEEIRGTERRCPPVLELFQRIVQVDGAARVRNQERLRALAREHAAEVRVFCAHDATELRGC